jgi:ubiquinone/menaquinone biosynthesis C-methylase UbiE
MSKDTWENFYSKTPLDKIPWQKSKDDFLVRMIESQKIKSGTALDLGCGTGMKSILLAKNDFKVTGIDISETAINYAKENAKKENANVNFFVGDVTELNFLDDKKFDVILDWACFHCVPKDERGAYLSEILKHSKLGTKFILRCFSNEGVRSDVADNPAGKIYLSSVDDVKNLFGNCFNILEMERKNSSNPGRAPSDCFYEFLMQRTK